MMTMCLTLSAQCQVTGWGIQVGGPIFYDNAGPIAVDQNGNVFISGIFQGIATFGDITSINDSVIVYLAKYKPDGTCEWVRQVGTTWTYSSGGICIDSDGNILVTGSLSGRVFVAKYTSTGSLLWNSQTSFTGGFADDITLDASDNAYIIGSFTSSKLNFGSDTLISKDKRSDIFIAKYSSEGNIIWAKKLGVGEGHGITVNQNDTSLYVTGEFLDTLVSDDSLLKSKGKEDIFIAKFTSMGTAEWCTRAGYSERDAGYAITSDRTGNVFVTGSFWQQADFDTITMHSRGYGDIFVAKYTPSGKVEWVKRGGGYVDVYPVEDYGAAISIDKFDNVYVTGYFLGNADYDGIPIASTWGFFVAKHRSDGTTEWVKQEDSSVITVEYGRGIAVDDAMNVYVTGHFESTGSNDQIGSLFFGDDTLTANRTGDGFLWKIIQPGASVEKKFETPEMVTLKRVSPNPTDDALLVKVELKKSCRIQILVADLLGRTGAELYDQLLPSGIHTINIPAESLPKGNQYLVLQSVYGCEVRNVLLR